MKHLIFVAVVLVAGKADAGWTWEVRSGHTYDTSSGPASYELNFVDRSFAVHTWLLTGLTNEDKGTTFTLDATTAAGYGFDWNALADEFLTGGFRAVTGGQVGKPRTTFTPWFITGPGAIVTDMELVFQPGGNGNTVLRIPAEGVPEPSSALVALVGFSCAVWWRRRHHHTPQPARQCNSRS